MERGGGEITLTIGHDEHEDVLFDIPRARIKVSSMAHQATLGCGGGYDTMGSE